ncbi:hypothetical protein [Polycladidibacter hongkongensis]|uniref:hypothetical protein n=1 Tax=Polycladidibacter hongkongensis TaxID=1647556 RepID=UPI00082CCA02|nr:hypothetical protein [Pseudovibrio hongkongensis]
MVTQVHFVDEECLLVFVGKWRFVMGPITPHKTNSGGRLVASEEVDMSDLPRYQNALEEVSLELTQEFTVEDFASIEALVYFHRKGWAGDEYPNAYECHLQALTRSRDLQGEVKHMLEKADLNRTLAIILTRLGKEELARKIEAI